MRWLLAAAVAALNLLAMAYSVLLICPRVHWRLGRVRELVLVLVLVMALGPGPGLGLRKTRVVLGKRTMRLVEVVAGPARLEMEKQPVLEWVTLRELMRVLEFGWTPIHFCSWS